MYMETKNKIQIKHLTKGTKLSEMKLFVGYYKVPFIVTNMCLYVDEMLHNNPDKILEISSNELSKITTIKTIKKMYADFENNTININNINLHAKKYNSPAHIYNIIDNILKSQYYYVTINQEILKYTKPKYTYLKVDYNKNKPQLSICLEDDFIVYHKKPLATILCDVDEFEFMGNPYFIYPPTVDWDNKNINLLSLDLPKFKNILINKNPGNPYVVFL